MKYSSYFISTLLYGLLFVLDVVILLSPTVSIEGQVDFKAKLDLTFIKKVLLMKELKSYESAHFQTCG